VLLVGTGGELPADPRHAALLARRLLEYKVPPWWICTNSSSRIAAGSLNSFWNLSSICHAIFGGPYWSFSMRRIFIAPSVARDAESTEAVIRLMSQDRKRGFAGIIATQHLSKLHKDAAAEAQ
jgi:hypothetical protein